METRFQTTSFIPKTSLDNVVSEDGQIQRRSGGGTTGNLMLLLCFFLFVCSLVSAGVVFFLAKLTDTTKIEVQKNLANCDFERSSPPKKIIMVAVAGPLKLRKLQHIQKLKILAS